MSTRTFHPTPDQVPAARRFVGDEVDQLGGSVDRRLQDDLALLTSEAVSNAVEYAATDIGVTVTRVGPCYLVSVHDDSPARIPEPGPLGTTATAGRGLAIIEAVAAGWGIDDIAEDGKTLWFVATPPELRDVAPRAPWPKA